MQKKIKRVALVDAGLKNYVTEAILALLSSQYEFQITNAREADYVFHSVDGYEVLNYTGVRIFVTGEYVTPNFNLSDYALAFDPIKFGDRYCRLPLIKLYKESYQTLVENRPPAAEAVPSPIKSHFKLHTNLSLLWKTIPPRAISPRSLLKLLNQTQFPSTGATQQ